MDPLPEWLHPGSGPPPSPPASSKAAFRAVRRTLGRIVRASALLLGGGGEPRGFFGRLDARSKVAGTLALLVGATFARRPESLAAAAGLTWLAALAGGVAPRRIALALSFVPLFGLVLALPAVFSPVTPGEPLLVLLRYPAGSWGPWRWPADLSVTAGGVYVALRLLFRSAACLSFAALLAASTPAPALWRAFRALGAPEAFVMTAGMMARYLELLLRGAEEVHLAKLSRGGVAGGGFERAWAGASLGEIFRRSRRLAGEVAKAMVSRGYTGLSRSLEEGTFAWPDRVFLILAFLGAAALALG